MQVGTFTRKFDSENDAEYFHGRLQLEAVFGEAFLIPNAAKRKETSHDWILKVRRETGFMEYGAAWNGKSQKGRDQISLSIRAPGVPEIRAYLFEADDQPVDADTETGLNVVWNVIWYPARGQGAAPVNQGEGVSDAIPFN